MNLKDGKMEFTVKVKATKGCDKFNIFLDLNPKNKLIEIGDALSHSDDLIAVFERIIKVIKDVDGRTGIYAKATTVDPKSLKELGFSEDAIRGRYQANFQPPFEKIDRIIYSHHSPGEAAVSHARSYNGDMPPSSF